MVQTIQHGRGDDGTRSKRITLLIPVRDLLLDALVRSSLVVILNVLPHQAMQLEAMEDEHIVQAFPFQTTDEALADTIGLRCSNRYEPRLDAGMFDQIEKQGAILLVSVVDEILGMLASGCGLS